MIYKRLPIFSLPFFRAKTRGLDNSLPRLLKIGAVAALACLTVGHSTKVSQAQNQSSKIPSLQLGLPQLGPAPIYDVPLPDLCWAPGTSPAKIAAYEASFDKRPPSSISSPFRVFGGRWTRTATNGSGLRQGDPTTITYSIVPDGTLIKNNPTDPNEVGTPSNLRARLNNIYGSEAAWLSLFAQVGQALSAQTGLTYVLEPSDDGAPFGPQSAGLKGARGDVRVSGIALDGNSGLLAYNYAPDFSDTVIDTNDDFFTNTGNNSLGFRNTVTHEFGHGLGLAHTCPIDETKLMEPFISFKFSGPQFDDVSGLQRFYGDPDEKLNAANNNDSAATATPLGAGNLPDGKVTRNNLSIDSTTDTDYFKFDAPAGKSVSVAVRPVGAPYLEGPQNADGSCTAGTLMDPKTINDLGLELLSTGANGALVPISTSNSQPAGADEVLPPTNLTGSGPYYVRVFGGTVDNIQRYSMDATIGAPVTTPTPGPTATPAPNPTPGPTATPAPNPTPGATPIRPIVDLNGKNPDGSTGQDSPVANGIDNVAQYFFQANDTVDATTGAVTRKPGGAQVVTPPETIVLSDIVAGNDPNLAASPYIVEARVRLTPDRNSSCGGQRIAPDNCNPQGKRDNEVLDLTAGEKKFLGDVASGITSSYNTDTQILTLKGANTAKFDRDSIRFLYEDALQNVTYENKLPIGGNNPFNRNPRLDDRIITYVVDTDNDDSNNQDDRFLPQEPGNPLQSKPAVLTLRFVERQSLVVTTLQDSSTPNSFDDFNARTDGATSLREAIQFANTIPASTQPDPAKDPVPSPPSVITFQPGLNGTISLNNPLPLLNAATNLTIQGPGARAINVNGDGSSSVFRTRGNVTISGLKISGGTANGTTTGTAGANYGGGIYNATGTLVVSACQIEGNSAQFGGGIANINGRLTVDSSTIDNNNSSISGGGIYSDAAAGGQRGSTIITNSTISGNTGGGGLYVNSGPASLNLSTVTNNSDAGVTVANGTSASASVAGSIISGNAGNNDVNSVGGNNGRFTSNGYNLIGGGNSVGTFSQPGDQPNVPGNRAGLGALGNNGGQTDTHALFAGSPAIDMGDPAPTAPPANDQRGAGFPRIFNNRIDIGAFEKQNNNPVTNVVISPRDPRTNDTLTANANSDTTNLTYTWTRIDQFGNRTQVQTGASNTLDLSRPGFGDRGDTILVTVTATNGDGSTDSSDSVVVLNTAPSFTLAITPNQPKTNQTIRVTPTSTDVDGDSLTYTYAWKVTSTVNGQSVTRTLPQETGPTLDLSKAGNGDRDEVVSVDVTGSDFRTNFRTGETTGSSVTNTASVIVANSAPTANNVSFSVAPGQTVSILLSASDPDAKDTFTFALTTNPTQGTASFVKQDGRDVLVYTANANATGTDSFRFTATDNNTAANGAPTNALTSQPATATVTISGTPGPTPTPGPTTPPGPTPTPTPGPTPNPNPNRPPVVVNTSLNATREVPVTKGLGAFDPDPADTYQTLTLKRVFGPRKGTGEIRKDTDGNWKLFYKASGLYQGNDEVQFVAIDSKGAVSNTATITINLFNTAPTARSTQMQVAAGGSADVGIFGQDVDRDALTFKSVGGPTKGTGEFRKDSNGNTRFYYQNSPVAVGDDEVRFVAIDSNGKPSAEALLTIKVIGVFNRAPVARNVSGSTLINTPVTVAVDASDPDDALLPAGQTTPLTFKRVGGPKNGTGEIQLDTDGVYKMFYTPRTGFIGTETIQYVAIDDKGKPSAPATITITVTDSASSSLKSGPAPSAGSS